MSRTLLHFTAVVAWVAWSTLGGSSSAHAERKLETYSAVEGESQQAKTSQRPKTEAAFDPVPADQLESIARRAQLAERLVREHARAYDYRAHTLAELESIVARLDLEKAQAQ